MKKLPKKRKKLRRSQKLERFAKHLPWLNLVLAGWSLSLALVFFGIAPSSFRAPTQLPAEPIQPVSSGQPLKVFLANLTGRQVTLFWVSEQSGQASVYLEDQRFGDDRGESTQSRVHQVTLSGLRPGEEYALNLCANLSCEPGGEDWYGLARGQEGEINPAFLIREQLVSGGQPLEIKTGQDLGIGQRSLNLIYGKASTQGLLLVSLENSGQVSGQLASAVESQGWAIDLANARTVNGQNFFQIGGETMITLKLISAEGLETTKTYPYAEIEGEPAEL